VQGGDGAHSVILLRFVFTDHNPKGCMQLYSEAESRASLSIIAYTLSGYDLAGILSSAWLNFYSRQFFSTRLGFETYLSKTKTKTEQFQDQDQDFDVHDRDRDPRLTGPILEVHN